MPLNYSTATKPAVLKRFTLIYLPVAIVLSGLLLLNFRQDEQREIENITQRENSHIELAKAMMTQHFADVNSDVRILANLSVLQNYLDSGNPTLHDEVAKYLLVLSQVTRLYDKVRYLDASGKEEIRINFNDGKPAIVPREELQDKSKHYFFRDVFSLRQGEIYVSPLDLNVEHNRLEIPFKPAIRFGTPVFDSAGRKQGILLLNYFANNLLQSFHRAMQGNDQSGMLINRDGYWLENVNHADEWGFMLGKNDRTFGHDFPNEWRTISMVEKGALLTAKGLFIYSTIHPLLLGEVSSTGSEIVSGTSKQMITSSDFYWKIISFTPHAVLAGALFYNQAHNRVLIAVIYLILALAAWIVSSLTLNRKYAEEALRVAATSFDSQQGMMITDSNNIILRVNQAFTVITGYPADEVIGKNPRLLSSGRHDTHFYASMWKRICSSGTWEGDIWNRRKNGECYPEHLTVTEVKDPNGNVTNYVGAMTDISLRKRSEEEIHLLAFYDPLTRLPNRRLLMDRLLQALSSSARTRRFGALLFIDLDNFKTLNDNFGHNMGDLLLQQVTERLTACVREADTVARLGGDEFVVILEGLSEQALKAAAQAKSVGEKILVTLNQPYQLATHEYLCTSSIGATLFHNKNQSLDELLKQADISMYQAKKAGRNTLRFFDPQMQNAINLRASIKVELDNALKKEQFQLYYQIQVDDSHRPLGAEALIRWIHPERGLVSPAQFIPLAEETGLILPIGQWVIETACAQLKIWQQDRLTRDLVLTINVSSIQFRQTDFVSQLRTAMQRHAINPNLFKLELTESLFLEDVDDTISTMNLLKEAGVRFSLDDFGTGYSCLQYLKRLPLDQIKIDQSFIRDLAVDSSDKTIVRTIIAMAHSLSMDVIAEGVETEEQRQLILDSGCFHFQGYLFGRPVPIEQFEALLKQMEPLRG
jgi:diguanylate cyclase (GGDEF)-like protein/PAS domain S-box-containing protein